MLYRLINYHKSPLVRRLLAGTILPLIPFLIVISIVLALGYHAADTIKALYLDLKALFTEAVPEAFEDLTRVIRDGGLA
jgi:hypothetical protein